MDGKDNQYVIGLGREISIVTWDGVSDKVSKLEKLVEVENTPGVDGNRFNDGKADPCGRLWAGKNINYNTFES